MKTKILFISHEASLTGAPLVLLYFMEWLKHHHQDQYEIGILHLKTGEIEERFNAVADKVHSFKHKTSKSLLYKVVNKLIQGKLAKKLKTPSNLIKLTRNNNISQNIKYKSDYYYLKIKKI